MAGTGFSIPCPWKMDSRFQSLARFRASYIEQAPAVQKLDNAIHRINSIQWIVQLISLIPIHWIVNLSGGSRYSSFEQPGLNSEFQTPELIPDQSTRKKFPGSGIRITVHLGYPLLTVFCSVTLEIRAGNKTWYLACLDSFLWKCYPWKRIHCTCHLVTLNISHWVKNLRCHLCFRPARILDGCYFL